MPSKLYGDWNCQLLLLFHHQAKASFLFVWLSHPLPKFFFKSYLLETYIFLKTYYRNTHRQQASSTTPKTTRSATFSELINVHTECLVPMHISTISSASGHLCVLKSPQICAPHHILKAASSTQVTCLTQCTTALGDGMRPLELPNTRVLSIFLDSCRGHPDINLWWVPASLELNLERCKNLLPLSPMSCREQSVHPCNSNLSCPWLGLGPLLGLKDCFTPQLVEPLSPFQKQFSQPSPRFLCIHR